MNWPYVAIGLIRRAMPSQLLFAMMHRRGDGNGAESSPGAYLSLWTELLDKQGVQIAGKYVLEVGSGRYARFALHLLAAGAAHVTLVDLYAVPISHPEHSALLARDCAELGLDVNDALARIELIRADFVRLPTPDTGRRVDLAISAAVLEHVYNPGLVFARCREWLKPGGVTAHIVDLRDHNMQFRYPFEMLTVSDGIWNSWLDIPGGFHLNRWRVPDYVRAAQEAGLDHVRYDITARDDSGLQAVLPRLNSRFRAIPEDMLAILGISLYGERRLDRS